MKLRVEELLRVGETPVGALVLKGSAEASYFGRDFARDVGVVAVMRQSGNSSYYLSHLIFTREQGEWGTVADHENGELWPYPPDAPRPHEGEFSYVGRASGVGLGDTDGGVVVIAGIVSSKVSSLEVSSPVDRHQVVVDAIYGSFVSIAQLDRGMEMRLVARDGGGRTLAEVQFSGHDYMQ